ncbi:hypothetical protein VIOR3934_19380 [Vibrio orientalis CIP 102891 = ATCC 33934]|uniref:Uncharacterized protein n=1 Tax=Vibrio orientalis CIP 102891 = ATCC 33934 TaxID=675816 RepID=F9SMG6_VIBOR|nr:hypothetical protein VIOR3934_19380 [Vibrio orientalis CIP 102891 = ATCC 33934]
MRIVFMKWIKKAPKTKLEVNFKSWHAFCFMYIDPS